MAAVESLVGTFCTGGFGGRMILVTMAMVALVSEFPSSAQAVPGAEFVCEREAILATGHPDPSLFARVASRDVRAFWCERYDSNGIAMRNGPYRETYSNGRTRTRGSYVDSHLSGPVSIWNKDGSLFLRGLLKNGEWSGPLEIFHESGVVWFEAHFDSGHLEGSLRTRFPDGAIESETRYQAGREDGLARSFYPTTAGGRLKSEAHVEADQLVGRHRLLNASGELIRSIDWAIGPAAWRSDRARPAAPDFTAPVAAPALAIPDQQHDLRD